MKFTPRLWRLGLARLIIRGFYPTSKNYLKTDFTVKVLKPKKIMIAMGVTCRGICDQFRVKIATKQPKYATGHKRCTLCAAYFVTVESRCPCCRMKLRTRARSRIRI